MAKRSENTEDLHRIAREHLKSSGISERDAAHAGVIPFASARSLYAGFANAPALAFNYFDIDGAPVAMFDQNRSEQFVRLRYLAGGVQRGFVSKALPRYAQAPGSISHLYFPRNRNFDWAEIASNPHDPLLITEGEKKALKACREGFPTIGLGGVWCFKRDGRLLPEFDRFELEGRPIWIVFDSDASTNLHVRHAQRALTKLLVERGAKVHIIDLPHSADGTKQGLDDYLVQHGAQAFQALTEEACPVDKFASQILTGSEVEVASALHMKLCDRYASQIVHTEGRFYAFTGKAWEAIGEVIIRRLIYDFDGTPFGEKGKLNLSSRKAEGILSILRDEAHEEGVFDSRPNGVNCETGFVSFDQAGTPSITAHHPEQRQRFCLKASWTPAAARNGKLLKTLLDGCFSDDEQKKLFLQECLGLAMLGAMTQQTTPQAIVLHGVTAANGKSEVLELFRALFPRCSVSSIPPGDFADDRKLIELNGKALNLCSELGTARAITSDTFKAVITGDEVTARAVYAPAVSFKPRAMHLFATNTLPGFSGGMDEGVIRRLAILEFNRTIPEDERIPNIGQRIAAQEGDALLAWAIEGASRVIQRGGLMALESSRTAVREWAQTSDIVLAWLAERCSYAKGGPIPTRHLHEDFMLWAMTNGYSERTTPAAAAFSKRVVAAGQGKVKAAKADGQRALVGLRLKPLLNSRSKRLS